MLNLVPLHSVDVGRSFISLMQVLESPHIFQILLSHDFIRILSGLLDLSEDLKAILIQLHARLLVNARK